MWFSSVFGPGDAELPVDFQVAYCNKAACFILNLTKEQVMGTKLGSTPLLDEDSRKSVFEQCCQVWTTGKTLEFTYYNASLKKYLHTQRTRLKGGILNITRDHTQLMNMKTENEKQAELLNNLIAGSPYGISLYESMRNERNEIVDFKLKLCNQRSADITAFTMDDLYKYTVKELILKRGHSGYFEMCRNVVETGAPLFMEYFAQPRNQWIGMSIVKFNDGYLLNYIDITQTKAFEKQAKQHAELLQGVLNASITGLFALEPILGFSGKILDFKFILFNKAAERLLKLKPEDKNKTYLTLFPTAKANGLFDMHCEVFSTGEPLIKTINYKGEMIDNNYLISISKMGEDGVVQAFSELK